MEIAYRHEIRIPIGPFEALELEQRLSAALRTDNSAKPGGEYRVRSLCFEEAGERSPLRRQDGLSGRIKFRLRLYDGNMERICLEKRVRHCGLAAEQCAWITAEECAALLQGNLEPLRNNGSDLAGELCARLRDGALWPSCVVDHRRRAFVSSQEGVRVRLDTDIRGSENAAAFLDAGALGLPAASVSVLEVQFESYLPRRIAELTRLQAGPGAVSSKAAALCLAY